MFLNFFLFSVPLARGLQWLIQLDHNYTLSFNLLPISHPSIVPYKFQIIPPRATFRPVVFVLGPKLSITPLRLYTEGVKCIRSLGGKPEGKRKLGRPRRRWEDNIKINVKKVMAGRGLWFRIEKDCGLI